MKSKTEIARKSVSVSINVAIASPSLQKTSTNNELIIADIMVIRYVRLSLCIIMYLVASVRLSVTALTAESQISGAQRSILGARLC